MEEPTDYKTDSVWKNDKDKGERIRKTEGLKRAVIWAGRICAGGASMTVLFGFLHLYHVQKANMEVMASGNPNPIRYVNEQAEEVRSNGIMEGESEQLQDYENPELVAEETDSLSMREGESYDWQLTLVNPWHTLDENYSISVVELTNGQSVDERCYPELQAMMDDCRAEGLSPYICSSYRTWEKQNRLFEENVRVLMTQGYSEEEARTETAKNIAIPGTSEHQLGLAVDIVDKNYQLLDESQEDTAVQRWLMENSWRYGFILRYPVDKSEITGIVYEPWHYRYVGREAAEAIYKEGICLEEYLEKQN
ncbi:MAG: M15 family metallopeptidase [Bacteroides sp.]|nr:M15 family metallopeptidase [Bacteroides sp.]MCM1549442.1 M15 family metallopeptidase [Clostridium sp.]